MSDRRKVWKTLADLLARLEQDIEPALGENGHSGATLKKLEKEVRKLGKAQFKANVLAEEQVSGLTETLASAQEEQERRDELLETLIDEQIAAARHELLEAVLPALDGLEKAMASGKQYLRTRDTAASVPDLTPEQAVLVSPADRAMVAGWLDGLRLVRERLVAILEAGGVTPIPTVGQPFDPYLHVAVDTTTAAAEGDLQPGTIVAEERRGYRSPAGVLRYAEVIVYRPQQGEGEEERKR